MEKVMGLARKTTDGRDDVIYVRFKDPDNMRFIYKLMAETDQPMREIVERMAAYCRKSKGFAVPQKYPTYVEKHLEAKKRRVERYKKLAAE
jgi:hypothetical protein